MREQWAAHKAPVGHEFTLEEARKAMVSTKTPWRTEPETTVKVTARQGTKE